MDSCSFRIERPHKGESLITFLHDFVVLDIETTGYMPMFDEIIEIGCIRVRCLEAVDTFHTLIKPKHEINDFIVNLTGITNEMVAGAPSIQDVLPDLKEFIAYDIIVGHNVNFDVNFLYDAFRDFLQIPLSNDFIDTLRFSRRMFPSLPHHRLQDMVSYFCINSPGEHRSLFDCESTLACYLHLLDAASESGDIEAYLKSLYKPKTHKPGRSLDLRTIIPESAEVDPDHPLFGKHCVFTGALEKMTRAQAAQIVTNIGGICDNGVTKNTNYLILGNNDYCKTIKDGKSAKQKKAEQYKLDGYDIEIIPEEVFYDLVLDE